jgi:hypothetical protein
LAEPGEIEPGEIASIGKRRDQAGLWLSRRQVEKAMRRTLAERVMNPFGKCAFEACAIRARNLPTMEITLRGNIEIKWYFPSTIELQWLVRRIRLR